MRFAIHQVSGTHTRITSAASMIVRRRAAFASSSSSSSGVAITIHRGAPPALARVAFASHSRPPPQVGNFDKAAGSAQSYQDGRHVADSRSTAVAGNLRHEPRGIREGDRPIAVFVKHGELRRRSGAYRAQLFRDVQQGDVRADDGAPVRSAARQGQARRVRREEHVRRGNHDVA
jgi:hypothetical protein